MNKEVLSSSLSVEQQIEVLNAVEKQLKLRNKFFSLSHHCRHYAMSLFGVDAIGHVWNEPTDIIPLYTYKNATKFRANRNRKRYSLYWWNAKPYNFRDRKRFVKWMLSELNKQKGVGE